MNELWTLFDLCHSLAGDYLEQFDYPWQALPGLGEWILKKKQTLGDEYEERTPEVWVHRTATVAQTAFLSGPCIIGAGTQVRHGAYIRGSVLIGENCVVGNSTEVKNAILFDRVQVSHFNYVGDSILGHGAHLGAGAAISNVRADKQPVRVRWGDRRLDTGLKKFGALVGAYAEIGCNAVLNPGTILGRYSQVYPCSCVRGAAPKSSIWKNDGTLVRKEGR